MFEPEVSLFSVLVRVCYGGKVPLTFHRSIWENYCMDVNDGNLNTKQEGGAAEVRGEPTEKAVLSWGIKVWLFFMSCTFIKILHLDFPYDKLLFSFWKQEGMKFSEARTLSLLPDCPIYSLWVSSLLEEKKGR